MHRFGSSGFSGNNMNEDDIFVARLQLLIIMSKAFLKDFTMGEYQKKAIIENARTLYYSSLFMGNRAKGSEADSAGSDNPGALGGELFLNKIRLLSVAATAFAEGRFSGEHKKKELQETIDFISKKITFEPASEAHSSSRLDGTAGLARSVK